MLTLKSMKLSELGLRELASELVGIASTRTVTKLVIPINGQVFVAAMQNPAMAEVLQNAEFVVADGISITLGRRFLGDNKVIRVPGVDLMVELCNAANERGLRIFLLGGRERAGEQTVRALRRRLDKVIFTTYCPRFGFEHSESETGEIISAIRSASPHIVFVGFGAPKQELFMDQVLRQLEIPVIMSVGGSFDMLGGLVQRAPKWIRKIGFEWLFRAVIEPKRLMKRYLVTNTTFCVNLFREKFNAFDGRAELPKH
jgi:N-acetylglucosaminyldiphosphoundecaprenol N-acetyl-beta-D-mannosaminyltransferase